MKTNGHTVRRYAVGTFTFVLAVVGIGAGLVYLRFRQDIAGHEARIARGSHLIDTPCGTLEYGEQGEGQPVLVSHGAGGGYDQGLLFSELIGTGYRVIAPSRFGYLNTPYPEKPTGAAQADADACLLDHLQIDHLPVIAFSAGGPSALQFALRHPERIDALIMVSAISDSSLVDPRPVDLSKEPMLRLMLTDFVYWAAATYFPADTLSFFGVSREAQQRLTPAEHARLAQVLQTMLPIGMRQTGNIHDPEHWFEEGDFTLERIQAPTLVIHATDDTFVPLAHGQYSAEHIPHARLATYDYGGHMVIVRDVVAAEIRAFLAQNG